MKKDQARIQDIVDSIKKIERYASLGRAEFEKNELIQIWIIHYLQIIGEASRKISGELRNHTPEIPWQEIIAMRNILVHEYSGIDVDEVWSAVETDLPVLKEKIEKISLHPKNKKGKSG